MFDFASMLLGASLLARMDTIFASGFEFAGTCPDSRQENSNVSYTYNLNPVLQNVDVTQFANVWGRASANDTIVPWPGKNGYAIMVLNRNLFMSTRFTVPASGLSPTLHGLISHGETIPGPNLTLSISDQCGDFNPPSSFCSTTDAGPGQIMAKWRLPTGTGNACVLTPGQEYYVNFKLTNPNAVDTNDCDANICVISIVNNVTP
jgi:hypothetical protein